HHLEKVGEDEGMKDPYPCVPHRWHEDQASQVESAEEDELILDLRRPKSGSGEAEGVQTHRRQRRNISEGVLPNKLRNLARAAIEPQPVVKRIAINPSQVNARCWPMSLVNVGARTFRE